MPETAATVHDPSLKASVLIVTFNTRRWLARQRLALLRQCDQRFEIIVVDNGSRPEERPGPDDVPPGARIIQLSENCGFARGCNIAAAAAHTDLLVFLNPDAFPFPDWISALVSAADRLPLVAAFGSVQWRADAEGVLDGVGDMMHASGLAYRAGYGKRRSPPPEGEVFAACGAALMVRRGDFAAVRGFDERYFCYFEDVDLCFRLRLAGARIAVVPSAQVFHVGGGSIGRRSSFADYLGARNRLWTFVKCMPTALFWPLLPVHVGTVLAVSLVHIAQGRGAASLRGVLTGLGGLWPFLRDRRLIQASRRVGVGAVASRLVWAPWALITRAAKVLACNS
jgi:N-acetylglucosaminyl-diphospho-decaprenol L-rhamnosyltransferase